MSLKNNIKKSIGFILMIVLFITFSFITYAFSNNLIDQKINKLEKDVKFLISLERDDNFFDLLDEYKKVNKNIRLTYINDYGKVEYDSDYDIKELKNHSDRIEFIDSLNKDISKSIRNSNTLGKKNYYIAIKGKNVLRISEQISIFRKIIIFNFLIMSICYLLIIFVVNKLIDKALDKIIHPIKQLTFKPNNIKKKDIENSYEEIKPYLHSIYDSNKKLNEEIKSLKLKEIKIYEIANNMKEAISIIDKDKVINLANNVFKQLFSFDDRKIKKAKYLLPEKLLLKIDEVFLTEEAIVFDLKIEDRYYKIFLEPIKYRNRINVLMLFVDYTEDKKGEILRREFTANVSHELKSPLTSINGYAELISIGIANEKDIKKFADIIQTEGNRLLDTIDDLIKLSKLDEKNEHLLYEKISIKDIFNQIDLKFKRKIDEKNISCIYKIDDIKINTNKALFIDLCTNLFENAIKYNKINGRIIVETLVNKQSILLSIKDSGIGISKKDQHRIFERFYMVDKSRNSKLKSTGLGLSIVKHIVDNLGFKISVESTLGVGSQFDIYIPK